MPISSPQKVTGDMPIHNRSPKEILDNIMVLIRDDFEIMNQGIQERLASDVVLINQLSHYIIGSGGKRLRPVCHLLAAKALDYRGDKHTSLAAIIEFIHTATLLHDDVVDASTLRRGRETANAIWGNEASVLVGDFLYSRSFEMMVDIGSMRVMEILSKTTNTIAEGEVLQLLSVHSPDVTEARYMDTIRRKTAELFQSATRLAAVLSEQPPEIEMAMQGYGLHLGNAFQLIDDVLDYCGDSGDIGKNIGDDLAEGKPTLPLIIALQNGDAAQQAVIRDAIENGRKENIAEVITIIENTGALDYTRRRALEQVNQAKQDLAGIPDSGYKQAHMDLADFSIARTF